MYTKQLLNIDKQKIEKATSVIQSLIQGLHPETDEPLAEDSVFQDARVLRSLLTVEECLKAVRGRAWSDEEDARLKGAFQNGTPYRRRAFISLTNVGKYANVMLEGIFDGAIVAPNLMAEGRA